MQVATHVFAAYKEYLDHYLELVKVSCTAISAFCWRGCQFWTLFSALSSARLLTFSLPLSLSLALSLSLSLSLSFFLTLSLSHFLALPLS